MSCISFHSNILIMLLSHIEKVLCCECREPDRGGVGLPHGDADREPSAAAARQRRVHRRRTRRGPADRRAASAGGTDSRCTLLSILYSQPTFSFLLFYDRNFFAQGYTGKLSSISLIWSKFYLFEYRFIIIYILVFTYKHLSKGHNFRMLNYFWLKYMYREQLLLRMMIDYCKVLFFSPKIALFNVLQFLCIPAFFLTIDYACFHWCYLSILHSPLILSLWSIHTCMIM